MYLKTFRALLMTAALFGYELSEFNVSADFLHGKLDSEVYGERPPDYENGAPFV